MTNALINIQRDLKAPKGQMNKFGGYKYRSCEDILEAVKPLLARENVSINITDDVVAVLDRVYVKATVSLVDSTGKVVGQSTALAREAENKKGMDDSQITGTASSYARKYALNGLLAIDDTKDADTDEHTKKTGGNAPTKEEKKVTSKELLEKLDAVSDNDELDKFRVDYKDSISTLEDADTIRDKFKEIKNKFRKEV